jgi:hypothetical protein
MIRNSGARLAVFVHIFLLPFLGASPARAQVVISDTTQPNPAYGSGSYVLHSDVSWYRGKLAVKFTADAFINLESFSAGLWADSPAADISAFVYADSANLPGVVLGSVAGHFNFVRNTNQMVSFDLTGGSFSFAPGESFWVGLVTTAGFPWWRTNVNSIYLTEVLSTNVLDPTHWTSPAINTHLAPMLILTASPGIPTAVPEPSSFLPLIVVLATGLGFRKLRKSQGRKLNRG